MLTRRDFQLGAAATVIGTSSASRVWAQDDVVVEGNVPPLPDDLVALADVPPITSYDETQMVGVQKPSTAEIEAGTLVLLGAPFNTTPLKVAEYFYDIGQGGKYPDEYRKFAREWPIRANPVIHQFFTATKTFPEGDTTPWCAAFVNWCIARSLVQDGDAIGRSPSYYVQQGVRFPDDVLNRTSKSASSGSFRCFPMKTSGFARGDIITWLRPGTENTTKFCNGRGHVAFFLEPDGDSRYRILGGNQTLRGTNGAVTITSFPKSLGDTHRFFGIHDWNKNT